MRIQIVNCTSTYGQILTIFELDTANILETPGSANLPLRLPNNVKVQLTIFYTFLLLLNNPLSLDLLMLEKIRII